MNRLVLLLLFALSSQLIPAEPIRVQHKHGSMRGFLLVKSPQGKVIGVGDMVQVAEGAYLRSRLVFRFRDGSIDAESTVFCEDNVLSLISDRHVQKGPSFPTPLNLAIDVPAGEVIWHERKNGKIEVNSEHLELPNDLANGLIPLVLENVSSTARQTKVSYLASDPKPRIVKLRVKPEEQETFSVAGVSYLAKLYVLHVELGGLEGVMASVLGNQPADIRSWVVTGDVPAVAKIEGAFYLGGPLWTVELTSPVWPLEAQSR